MRVNESMMEDLSTDHWPTKKNGRKTLASRYDAYALSYKYGTCFAYNAHVNEVNFCTYKPNYFFNDISMIF
jgi:hypothetical protein